MGSFHAAPSWPALPPCFLRSQGPIRSSDDLLRDGADTEDAKLGDARHWSYFIMRNCADALKRMQAGHDHEAAA